MRLDRPDVEVLAGVRARHDRDLGRFEVEGLDAAGLDERDHPERLDGGTQRHHAIGIAKLADQPAAGVGLDDVPAVDALLDPVAQAGGRGPGCQGAAGFGLVPDRCEGARALR